MATSQTVPAYFAERLTQLNIPAENAHVYGLSADDAGNIQQQVRTFTGRPVLWQDRRGARGRHIARINARKSFNECGGGEEQHNRPLCITRLNPANTPPGAPKYRYPSKETTGHGIKVMPTPKAIEAFNAGAIGGTGVGVEGYFKALALGTLADVEAIAFSGISVYRICADVAEYITARKFDRFIILYDADARELRIKSEGNISAARVLAFRDSAARFAAQFFELIEREHLNTKLYFAAVSSDAAHKGIDDLLAAVDNNTRANIAAELRDAAPDAHFDIFELKKSAYKRTLNDYFGTRTHETFYARYGHLIGDRPFTFGRGTYAMSASVSPEGIFGTPSARLKLLNDPFAVDVPAACIDVEKFMDEARAAIDEAISTSPRVCITAPTGTGKTSYFLGHRERGRRVPGYFERTGTRGVLCVPYVALAKQLAAMYGIPALYGRIGIREREAAHNAPAYIVTYDNLRHCDLYGRVLVVDEGHNLIAQYGDIAGRKPFRAAVLRAVVERFADADKTILISGTPPRLMAKHFNFSFVEVRRRINNVVALRTIETETASADALVAAVLGAMLPGVKEHPGQVHCVFWNSRRRLAILRDALIGAGIAADDIALLTRADVLNGHPVYNGIVNNERIDGIRVVLSTCLISEGVNIQNTNIGGVLCVDVNDPAAFIQYTARFRKIERLNVVSIRKPERALDDMFFADAGEELALELERANIQRRIVEHSRIEHGDELGDELAPFADELAPSYRWAPDILREVYFDSDGRPRVDELFILARIRERMVKHGNNVAFYSELCRAGNIHFIGANEKDAEPNAEAAQLANDATASAADKKAATMAHLADVLHADPGIVVSAYHARVKRAGNRHASARIEALAPDLLNHPGAAMYEAQHGEHFAERYFADAINQFCRARFMGEDAIEAMKETPGKFAERWRRYKRAVEFSLYDNRRTRAMLRPQHKAEIRFFIRAQQAIAEAATHGNISLADVVKILKERTRAMSAATFTQMSIVPITPAEAERIVKMLFQVKTTGTATGKTFSIYPAARLELGTVDKYLFIF